MSETTTAVFPEYFRYLADRTRGDDDFLVELKAAAVAAGIPAIAIDPAQASFVEILLKAARAREVVEVGTLAGYSAIHMARALPADGTVKTIEIEPMHADFAEAWIAKSDVAGKVSVLRGTGADVLATIPDSSADAVFLDADKKSYPHYLREARRIVRRGGMILVDNAFAFGQLFDENPTDPDAPYVKDFNEIMAQQTGLHGIIAPFGDGLWVAVDESDSD